MLERNYQSRLIQRILTDLPGSNVLHNDPNVRQGYPDLTVRFNGREALLEVKASAKSPTRPNQKWYIENSDSHVFASFIYPENEEAILELLYQALQQ